MLGEPIYFSQFWNLVNINYICINMIRDNYFMVYSIGDYADRDTYTINFDDLDKLEAKANEILLQGGDIHFSGRVSELYAYIPEDKITRYKTKIINI